MLELLVQVVAEVVADGMLRRLRGTTLTARGRLVLGAVLGLLVGLGWGALFTDLPSPPKLLWFSIALALPAVALAVRATSREPEVSNRWARPEIAPWRWPAERLWSLALLNITLALGVLGGWAL